jgi:exosortase/archaeosortase family protein
VTRRDRWRFGCVVAAMSLVVLLAPRRPVEALAPFDRLTAAATAAVLRGFGTPVVRSEGVLRHAGGFSYEIYYRCTGLLGAGFLAAVILASPAPARRRWIGAGVGIAVVLAVNLVRLVSLFLIGVRAPAFFHFAHVYAWEGVLVAVVAGFWAVWRSRPRGEAA